MNDSTMLSGDDSERFILPDGEVLTREQMEAKILASVQPLESHESCKELLELIRGGIDRPMPPRGPASSTRRC